MPPAPSDPPDPAQLDRWRELAERAARAGGAVARAAFGRAHQIRRKADGSEVSEADEAAQAAAIACLRGERPDDPIIAEETLAAAGGGPRLPARPRPDRVCWIIDPIDGTRNYIRGVPLYSVSVAAMLGGYPIVGVVYAPERDECYSADAAGPLRINGQPAPADALPAPGGKPLVGIPSSLQRAAYDVLQQWYGRVVVRNLGSTALHLALVAAGRFQAALLSDSKLWDLAAGWLLIRRTDGVMTTLAGHDVFPLDVGTYAGESIPSLAAATPRLHAELLPGGGSGA